MYTNARGTLNKENRRIAARMKISKSYTKVLLETGDVEVEEAARSSNCMVVRIVVTGGCLSDKEKDEGA